MAAVDTLKSDEATAQEEEERKGIISRVMNLDVKVDKGGTRATVVLPGLSYDDFDRTGQIGIWKMAMVLMKTRVLMWMKDKIFSNKMIAIMASKLPFVLGSQVIVTRNFYKLAVRKQCAFPLEASTTLAGVGNSTTVFLDSLCDAITGEELASEVNLYVTVDMETRKPVQLPKKEQAELDPALFDYKPPKFPRLSLPSKPVYTKVIIPGHSETDGNFHTNRAVYIKFAMNCAAEASISGFYSYFKKDIAHYNAKRVTLTYHAESYAGDELEMATWEDTFDHCKLYFKLLKHDKSVMDCIIEFYQELQSQL